MYPKQKIFAVIASVALLVLVGVLIKRRKLREEYSLLWLATGVTMLVLVLGYPVLRWLSELIGAVAPTTTLFLFAMLFLILISIHFSVKFTTLSDQMQNVITELALLRKELEDLKKGGPGGG